MKILTISAKENMVEYYLYDMNDNSILVNGIVDRIGLDDSSISISHNNDTIIKHDTITDYNDTVSSIISSITSLGIINSINDINGIGFRVVHGGSKYTDSVFVNDGVITDIEDMSDLAPLYNDKIASVMRVFRKSLPDTPMVAVFDSSFYQSIDEENYLYSVPYDWYEKYGIRKYGFYGTSHKYVSGRIRDILERDDYKLISCHLGNGGSVSAIRDGVAIDTSMGFTPLSGIMMGTRSGDIDPSIIPYVMEREGKNVGEVIEDLNLRSGLFGISKYSGDMKEILDACDKGDKLSILAKNKFVRRVVDYISAYYVLLNGADAIVFTAGIGENSVQIRREICERLTCLGVKIDLDLNNVCGDEAKISTDSSSIDVYVIPTDEELMVALDTYKLISNR